MSSTRLEKIQSANSWKTFFEGLLLGGTAAGYVSAIQDGPAGMWLGANRFFFAPLAIISSVFQTIFAWRTAALARSNYLYANAVITTIASAAYLAAGVGLLAAVGIFAFVAPVLISAALAVKGLFDICSSIYFAGKASILKRSPILSDMIEFASLKSRARDSAVSGAVYTVMAAAMITLTLVAAPVVQIIAASIGIAAFIASIAYDIFRIVKSVKAIRAIERRSDILSEPGETLDLGCRATRNLTNNAALTEVIISGKAADVAPEAVVATSAPKLTVVPRVDVAPVAAVKEEIEQPAPKTMRK
jgi:hypothetical protein